MGILALQAKTLYHGPYISGPRDTRPAEDGARRVQLLVAAILGLAAGVAARGWRGDLAEALMKTSVIILVFLMGLRASRHLLSDEAAGILALALLIAVLPGLFGVTLARLLLAWVEGRGRGGGLGRPPLGGLVYLASMIAGALAGSLVGFQTPGIVIDLLLVALVALASYTIGGAVARNPGVILEGSRLGLILSLSVVAGGIAGGLLAARLAGQPVPIVMVASLASGWYSLAGPLLLPYDSAAATAALLGNMLREALHIISYPVMSRVMPLSWLAMGGATTMDTGLPVVAAYGGDRERVAAFVQGAILTLGLSIGLPALVSLLLG